MNTEWLTFTKIAICKLLDCKLLDALDWDNHFMIEDTDWEKW